MNKPVRKPKYLLRTRQTQRMKLIMLFTACSLLLTGAITLLLNFSGIIKSNAGNPKLKVVNVGEQEYTDAWSLQQPMIRENAAGETNSLQIKRIKSEKEIINTNPSN